MNIMMTELYDALMSAGADEAKARRAAESMASSNQDMERKFTDLRDDNQKMRVEMAKLNGDLRLEMQGLRGEMSLIKWMLGVLIALGVAVFLRVLFL